MVEIRWRRASVRLSYVGSASRFWRLRARVYMVRLPLGSRGHSDLGRSQ